MPLAELAITSVKVEGRTKPEVARDYRVSRYWVDQLVEASKSRGRPPTNPLRTTALQPSRSRPTARRPDPPEARNSPSEVSTPEPPEPADYAASTSAVRTPAHESRP